MRDPLFVVRVVIDGECRDLPYATHDEFFIDRGLETLFEHVESCVVYAGSERLAGVGLATYARLVDVLASNATKLFRRAAL